MAKAVLEAGDPALERYLTLVSAGGSDYPVELLETADGDLTTREPYQPALALMNRMLDEVEAILEKKGL